MSVVPGVGPRDAKMMLVGEAPAHEEVKQGIPFVGRAGQELNSILSSINVPRPSLYITNASREPVQGDKKKFFFDSGEPTQTYLQGIAQLYKDIQEIKPNVVVPLGNYALWALMLHEKIMTWRGSVLWSETAHVKVIPTIHPAAILHGDVRKGYTGMWKYRPIIILDLLKAYQQSKFKEMRLTEREIVIVEDLDDPRNRDAIRRLREAKRLVFDIESYGGLDLACVGFSDGDPTWAVCIPYNGDSRRYAVYQELLGSDVSKEGQNLMYDVSFFDQIGIEVRNVKYDTMVAQHVVMPDLPLGLDFMTSIYTDIPYYKEEGKIWKQSTIPDYNKFWQYNGKDVCATAEVANEQKVDIAEDEAYKLTFARDMAAFELLRQTTKDGWLVDREKLKVFIKDTEAERDKQQALLTKLAGYDFNPRSHVQVRDLIPELPDTQASTLMQHLIDTGDMRPWYIIKVRQQSKLLSNYYKEGVVGPDDRIRYTFKIGGTKGSRLSASKPLWGPGIPIQTIPKKAREIFIVPPGYEVGNFDQAQAEAVVTAYYALDPIHMDCFRTGKDVHRVTACLLFDKPVDKWPQIVGKPRELAKRCNHAFNYGMGPYVLQNTVNQNYDPEDSDSLRINGQAAKALHGKYHIIRPAVQSYWDSVAAELRENDMTLVNALGRKREVLGKWTDTTLKDAYAWKPQSTVGDITLIGMIRVFSDPELTEAGVRLLTQTHDSNTYMWPIDNRDFVVPRIMKHMCVDLIINGYHIMIPIEAGCGPNWKAASDDKDPEHTPLGVSHANVEVQHVD